MANLDFDTNGSGATHTNGAGDSGDAYNNNGAGWQRIAGAYTATFDGNGHTIDNLFMRISGGGPDGLFRELSGSGVITSLGVRNAYVANASGAEPDQVGILVGLINDGDIVASYTTGYVRGYGEIGDLAGRLNHTGIAIKSGYSTATVAANTGSGAAGGPVGLALYGAIDQSYYAGASVTGVSNKLAG